MNGDADYRDWEETEGTIEECRLSFLSRLRGSEITDVGYDPYEYVVTFSYEADGHEFNGQYKANSPQEVGFHFPLRYLRSNPATNTAAKKPTSIWLKIVLGLIAIGCVLLLRHYFPDTD